MATHLASSLESESEPDEEASISNPLRSLQRQAMMAHVSGSTLAGRLDTCSAYVEEQSCSIA